MCPLGTGRRSVTFLRTQAAESNLGKRWMFFAVLHDPRMELMPYSDTYIVLISTKHHVCKYSQKREHFFISLLQKYIFIKPYLKKKVKVHFTQNG